MTMRDKIARIASAGFLQHWHTEEIAEAIMSALPDMIPDLVWVTNEGNAVYLCTTPVMYAREYSVRAYTKHGWTTYYGEHAISALFTDIPSAIAAANAHHRAAIMAAFKGETT
jgi:hypothetical protein